MKLLISLILILTISFINNCNAFLLTENGFYQKKKESNEKICFPNGEPLINGFNTLLKGVGYNSNYPSPNGGSENQNSYCTDNMMDVDFLNQRFSVDFALKSESGNVFGKFLAFTQNKTEYIITSENIFNSTCYISKMDYEIKSLLKLSFVSDIALGQVPCEYYAIESPLKQNDTIELVFVDKNHCSLMASISTLESLSNGESMAIYMNYVPSSKQDSYQLPPECENPTPIDQIFRPKLLNLFAKY
ncbi:hypothetical protein ACTFIZ_005987 [Dictyostelium cf. discoideum]